jgi:hypothetical protein
MLDYSIRGPLAASISPGFYGWTDRGGSSSTTTTIRSSQLRSDYLHGWIVVVCPQETSSPSRPIMHIAPHGSRQAIFIGLVSSVLDAPVHGELSNDAFRLSLHCRLSNSSRPVCHIRSQPQLRAARETRSPRRVLVHVASVSRPLS